MHRTFFYICLGLLFSINSIQAENKSIPEEAKKTADVDWRLVKEFKFSTLDKLGKYKADKYSPYLYPKNEYFICSYHKKPHIIVKKDGTADVRNYEIGGKITFRPKEELLLSSSRVYDSSLNFGKKLPHTFLLILHFRTTTDINFARVEPDGIVLVKTKSGEGFDVSKDKTYRLIIKRLGEKISYKIDKQDPIEIKVDKKDRTALSLTSQQFSSMLIKGSLYFGNGEKLSAPPKPKPGVKPKWEVVYTEDFSKKDKIKKWICTPKDATFKWEKEEKALHIGPKKGGSTQCYALLSKSLPGDIRIKLRARNMRPGRGPFFGLLVSLNGDLKTEDGYFIEWNYWQVQIKKKNVRKAGARISFPKYKNKKEWMNFSLTRIGGVLTMYTEGKKVLTWTDPHPYKNSNHDMLLLYTWQIHMEFDDIVIERNTNDIQKARGDHPINALQRKKVATTEAPKEKKKEIDTVLSKIQDTVKKDNTWLIYKDKFVGKLLDTSLTNYEAFLKAGEIEKVKVGHLVFFEKAVWAATNQGAFRYDRKTERWAEYAVNWEHIGEKVDKIEAGKEGQIHFTLTVEGKVKVFIYVPNSGKWFEKE